MYIYIYIYIYMYIYIYSFARDAWYGVATSSRLIQIIVLFCERALWKRRYSAKETYNFKEPTNRSHPIIHRACTSMCRSLRSARWLYTHVHMYICTHIRICTYTHIHIYSCTHTHIYTYTRPEIFVYVRIIGKSRAHP